MALLNRGLFLDAQHNLELRECPVREPGPGELLIKIRANGICGSDVHFFKEGRLGNFVVTEPYIPGHEASGTVVAAGRETKRFREGDNVIIEPGFPCGRCHFCKLGRYNLCPDVIFLSAPPVNGTFCDYVTIPESFAHSMPEGMSFEKAAVAEPAAVAVHAVNRARFRNGADGVIVGAGPIGLLTLQAFKAAGGGKVTCMDISAKRLEIAAKLGADHIVDLSVSGVPRDAGDVVFETAGSDSASSQLFNIVKTGGTVVQVGWPGSGIVNMNIAEFLDKELDYLGSTAMPTRFRQLSAGLLTEGFVRRDLYPTASP